MNSGISTGEEYDVAYAWPSDLIAIERRLPPGQGHKKWREIEGRTYYIPGEVCDPLGKNWFYVEGDAPRPDAELLEQFQQTKERQVNFLLDVPPGQHGLIPESSIQALNRLRKNAGIWGVFAGSSDETIHRIDYSFERPYSFWAPTARKKLAQGASPGKRTTKEIIPSPYGWGLGRWKPGKGGIHPLSAIQ